MAEKETMALQQLVDLLAERGYRYEEQFPHDPDPLALRQGWKNAYAVRENEAHYIGKNAAVLNLSVEQFRATPEYRCLGRPREDYIKCYVEDYAQMIVRKVDQTAQVELQSSPSDLQKYVESWGTLLFHRLLYRLEEAGYVKNDPPLIDDQHTYVKNDPSISADN